EAVAWPRAVVVGVFVWKNISRIRNWNVTEKKNSFRIRRVSPIESRNLRLCRGNALRARHVETNYLPAVASKVLLKAREFVRQGRRKSIVHNKKQFAARFG